MLPTLRLNKKKLTTKHLKNFYLLMGVLANDLGDPVLITPALLAPPPALLPPPPPTPTLDKLKSLCELFWLSLL